MFYLIYCSLTQFCTNLWSSDIFHINVSIRACGIFHFCLSFIAFYTIPFKKFIYCVCMQTYLCTHNMARVQISGQLVTQLSSSTMWVFGFDFKSSVLPVKTACWPLYNFTFAVWETKPRTSFMLVKYSTAELYVKVLSF